MSAASPRDPHLVMVVPNPIEGDSRVVKVAASAVRAGYRVTVVGAAGPNRRGAVLVGGTVGGRVPVEHLTAVLHASWAGQSRMVDPRVLPALERDERSASRLSWIGTPASRVVGRLWRERTKLRRSNALRRLVPGASRTPTQHLSYGVRLVLARILPAAGWRITWPWYVDLEDSFTPVLADLRPDLIHVHDVPLLPAAVSAARVLRRRGTPTTIVYDAHEWWPGVHTPTALARRAATAVESSHIRYADAVVTVGPVLADRLVERHRLPVRPAVVENCPDLTVVAAEGRRPLREEIGLDPETPLMVYAGAVALRRGLHTAVEALPALPGVHLAIVCGRPESPHVRSVVSEAESLGVAGRVHVRPYVPADAITWYLKGADVGVVPSHRTPSHDAAIPTKVSEYVQAGLPIVGSNCTAMADFLRGTGVGLVFPEKDTPAFAAAVLDVLADPARFRSAMTPELRQERSWETQEVALLDVYRTLVGDPPARTPGPPRILVVGGSPELVEGVQRRTEVSGMEVLFQRRYRRVVRSGRPLGDFASALGTHGIYYDGLLPAFGPLVGESIEDEIRLLRAAGVACAALASVVDIADPRLPARLQALGCQLLVQTPDLLPLYPGARWMPYVPAPSYGDVGETRTAGVLLHRVTDGLAAALTEVAGGAGASVHRYDGTLTPELLEGCSVVVVGRLEVGAPGPSVVQALAAGRTVVADVPDTVREAVPDLPVVGGRDLPAALAAVLAESPSARAAAARAYVARRHSVDVAAEVLTTALTSGTTASAPSAVPTGADDGVERPRLAPSDH